MTRYLYERWAELLAELRKVSRGKGDEKKIGRAIDGLIELQVSPQVVADVVASAGESATYAANKCKECAGHAREIARMTLTDYMGPKAKGKTTSKRKAGAKA